MSSMKLSVSLPDADVEYVDKYAAEFGIGSRSAVMHRAIALLRQIELEESYAAAATESQAVADEWDLIAADGLDDAAR